MVNAYTSKTNLVTEEVEALDALLGITNVLELGKAKTGPSQQTESWMSWKAWSAHPLQAPVAVSMMALLCSTSPKRAA